MENKKLWKRIPFHKKTSFKDENSFEEQQKEKKMKNFCDEKIFRFFLNTMENNKGTQNNTIEIFFHCIR